MNWEDHTKRAQTFKELFSFDDNIVYLNNAYMSPTMKKCEKAGIECGFEAQRKPWNLKFPTDFNIPCDEIRERFGKIANCSPDDVALVPSVAYAVEIACNALRNTLQKDDYILLLDDQYTSNALGWQRLAEQKEAKVEFIDSNHVLEGIARFNPKIIALPAQCHWCDGSIIDIETIAKVCHENGIVLFLDATQSLGAMPFDISVIKPDFLACAGYKWLFSPYSTSYLYIDPKHHEKAETIEMHGASRKHFGFLSDGSYDVKKLYEQRENDYCKGARKFDVGERSNFLNLAMAKVALDQIISWLENSTVANHTKPLLDYLCDSAEKFGMIVPPKDARAPHIVGLRFPNATPRTLAELSKRLANDKVLISIRGDAIRVSPHVWSTKDDIDKLIALLENASSA